MDAGLEPLDHLTAIFMYADGRDVQCRLMLEGSCYDPKVELGGPALPALLLNQLFDRVFIVLAALPQNLRDSGVGELITLDSCLGERPRQCVDRVNLQRLPSYDGL
jgi:hypothetical protein